LKATLTNKETVASAKKKGRNMEKRTVYEKLYKKLTAERDKIFDILKILFTREEAELALIVPFMPASLSDIYKGFYWEYY